MKVIKKKSKNNNPIEVKEVIENKTFHTLVEFELPFPSEIPALKIMESITKVDSMKFNTLKGGLIIEGEILKEIKYLSHEGKYKFKYKNEEVNSHYGSIKVVSARIPFSYYAVIDGIKYDDMLEFDCGSGEDSEFVDTLLKPFVCNCCGVNLYRSLNEKIVVIINIRVLRKKVIY